MAKTNHSPVIEKMRLRINPGKISNDTMLMFVAKRYADELQKEGLISKQQFNRAALLTAICDPMQPNQVRHMYEYQQTGKRPHGCSILDMRGYVAKLEVLEIVIPNNRIDGTLKTQTLAELACQLAAIEMRAHDQNSPNRYALFIVKAMAAVEHTLKKAGFTKLLNGTGMGIQDGMRIFRELVEEKKN